ncbi:MAG: 2-oxoglutarate dehydrogenase E1 component [Calditrichaeota bacterium]|nr:2-oxoglutarate dehydrogenase E1 component [Calditrichota bacterium]MCB9368968.1 2-oxoglutarate dehydrogenase E1 component [Calditrichota bacterium]
MSDLSFLVNADPQVIDDIYEKYRQQPDSVDHGWRKFFEGFEFARTLNGHAPQQAPEEMEKEFKVVNLIAAYRQRGHLFTKTNPVRKRRNYGGKLTLENFDLSEKDLDTVFQAGTRVGLGPAPLREIIRLLDETYCDSVGVEWIFMRDPKVLDWLKDRMESNRNRRHFTHEAKRHTLQMLTQAVVLEKFMHQRFVGQKRFSLEGLETFVPAMDAIVERGALLGIHDFVIGMAHRGRLNILTNVLDKDYRHIFNEFEGKQYTDAQFSGDVKYHLGHSVDKKTRAGLPVHLTVMPNPSHLEAINPVAAGVCRSKADLRFNGDYQKVLPILVHGDSAIAGQGVVYELLQMSHVDAYKTGGSLHIVLNNQVGFTTNYIEARSSTYCTDVAKTTLSPVFHVNGDDVEAVIYTVELALEFRQEFQRDVFIDILGYRKHGHNEGDEPRFTQPVLYKAIAAHPDPRQIYAKKLADEGTIPVDDSKQIEKDFRTKLDNDFRTAKEVFETMAPSSLKDYWKDLRFARAEDFEESPVTGVEIKTLKRVAQAITKLPEDVQFINKVERIFQDRRKMITEGRFDWAMGELLAYGTLCDEGFHVRLSGQDSKRGTFSHRHAMVRVEDSDNEYYPLQHISKKQGTFEIWNSILSEYAVMGYEYGYAMASPKSLVLWEAQFGDFANGAQIIIDQFVAGAEQKWRRENGLVLLLPHGSEGQGPEHTSCRVERYLEMCAGTNMQVVAGTSPANFFHVLRRQLARPFRTPLIVLTPKSPLRHPLCVSPIEEFGPDKRYQEVLDDTWTTPKQVKRVVFCMGKFYFDLVKKQRDADRKDVALVRLEQIFPLPKKQIQAILDRYPKAEFVWAQEEPANQGCWPFLNRKFDQAKLRVISRDEFCTPSVGFPELHDRELAELVNKVFAN